MRPVRDVAGSDILWQTVWKTVWQTAWMVWDLLNSCKFSVLGKLQVKARSVQDADVKMLKRHELKTVREHLLAWAGLQDCPSKRHVPRWGALRQCIHCVTGSNGVG